ncbi:MAG: dicarboxylate/amino acid:cation symporter [Planctomycetes bacterium]|nr:dicarboxylate/amino acid:cation symporter [Planctomycetota bacterium]MCB9868762.1 dicarboxylate/amino acid:cation symporter [Planctomycetota bacterium]
MRKLALHWWILIGMALGVGAGLLALQLGRVVVVATSPTSFVELDFPGMVLRYVAPFGDLFMNLLRMIAVPLVLFSLVAGVASLNDTAKVKRIGTRTIVLYLLTTAVAISIGLVVVNLIGPGRDLSGDFVDRLRERFQSSAQQKIASTAQVSIIQQLIDVVPKNPFEALARGEMLQVVFFALMLGIALTRLDAMRAGHAVRVFEILSDAVIEIVHLIMKIAPFGVFALIAKVVADMGQDGSVGPLFRALGWYIVSVVLALVLHAALVYTALLKFMTKMPLMRFFRGMVPAQLLAFSSSSSGATLPVTMRCAEKNVGVDEEVSGFVLPLGATINMDGTGLYQGVAAVFIANVYKHDLGFQQQLEIVLTATLASIGTAAVPGVGLVMLIIVLQQIGVDPMGIGLIMGVDRPLDMCRTVLNITGDATVATVVAAKEGMLHDPTGDDGDEERDDPGEAAP